MPISLENTHEHVSNTLPNASSLNFIVNGIPTKTNNVWRGLVELEKVYKALKWLIINNKLYKDVEVNWKLLEKDNSTIFESIEKNTPETGNDK